MEKYRMNQSGCRPYHPQSVQANRQDCRNSMESRNSMRSMPMQGRECDYSVLSALPPAMAYVPCQNFHTTFELCKALQVGTIFPELCKPFTGKRGIC